MEYGIGEVAELGNVKSFWCRKDRWEMGCHCFEGGTTLLEPLYGVLSVDDGQAMNRVCCNIS